MSYVFGNKSKKQLSTCHVDLQKVFNLAISRSRVDWGISEGHRPIKKQQQYYSIGRTTELHRKPITRVDGVNVIGKHNKIPSEAADIYAYHPDLQIRRKIIYDKITLSYVAGVIGSCAKELFEKGEISHLIRWGGNWDSNGIIVLDQSFDDLPHFELIKP